jgi:hypothetical protein
MCAWVDFLLEKPPSQPYMAQPTPTPFRRAVLERLSIAKTPVRRSVAAWMRVAAARQQPPGWLHQN